MLKRNLIAAVIGATLSPLALPSLAHSHQANSTQILNSEQDYFQQQYQSMFSQVNQRLEEVRALAEDEDNVIIQDGERYIEFSGIQYELNNKNNPIIPFHSFNDTSAIKALFPFFSADWELSLYQGGAVFVNKYFGNYNYGDGCLIEYFPEGSIQNGEVVDVVIETSSCSVNSFDTTVRYFGNPTTLTPGQLDQESFRATAVERYQDRIYVTRSVPNEYNYIDVYDINTHQKVVRLDAITTSDGQTHNFRQLNELYIEDNLLFIVSWEANRVDVLDLDNNHQHVMQIGIDTTTGSGLFRPQSIVGNSDYLFVSDARENIAVIQRSEITPENSNHMNRFASLAFGTGQYSHRLVQMHILGNYLLVNTSNNNYVIYDIRKIKAGETLQPEKTVTKAANKIDRSGDYLIVSIKNRLEWHHIPTFIENNFEFVAPEGSTHDLNNHQFIQYQDIHFDNNELVTVSSDQIDINEYIIDGSVKFNAGEQVSNSPITFEQIMPSAIQEVFTNNESFDLITNPSLRSARVNELVHTTFVDNNTVQITNYNAKTVTNVDLEARINGINKWFVLGNIDQIPPFTRITLPVTAFGNIGLYNSKNGDGVFDITHIMMGEDNFNQLLKTSFSSKTDKFVQKLQKIKPRWSIQTVDFTGGEGNNWLKMSPLHAREALIMLTNFAYMASSEEFKLFWFNFSEMFGNGEEMFGNAGRVEGPGGYFKPEDYEYYYNGMMNRDYLRIGAVKQVLGYGNVGFTGVSETFYYQHYYGYYGVLAHEFGHGFDGTQLYIDGSGFASSAFGFQPLMTELGMYLIRKGDIPYLSSDEDLNGFYKDENAQYRHFAATGKREHRSDSDSNRFDKWYMSNSTMPQGWFTHNESFQYQQLSNHEKISIAKLKKDGNQVPVCRFTQTIEGNLKTLYGFVDEVSPNHYQCSFGSEISYHLSDGSMIYPTSEINQFDWLSLHQPSKTGEQVLTEDGMILCSINANGFYGVGFKEGEHACTQTPEVHWSNGRRWYFSSKFGTYNYR
ncbi:YncE family protein [Vibrio azureus]|uniref:Peptidase M60 domain-containing protein n=1 Tax=Vibrio azureus NBRC 104587 TaxID=1219077 RepID=U3AY71_9VIBR|nr:hypothetical protein [Vibrio azureus]GAD78172.1 hypothetical protein VAZ01S_138_00010 [Vibrio azureus NBRC 104587]